MKKVVLILLIFICLSFTLLLPKNTKDENVEKEKNEYIKYVKKLKEVEKTSKDLPFDVETKYDKLTGNEIRYQIIIDNPKYEITNVKTVAIHNKNTDDIFPSAGIFEKPMKLSKDKKPEGIILVGYIPYNGSIKNFKCKIKVIIEYKYENKVYTRYYVTKK